jgi:hypothetical protein
VAHGSVEVNVRLLELEAGAFDLGHEDVRVFERGVVWAYYSREVLALNDLLLKDPQVGQSHIENQLVAFHAF